MSEESTERYEEIERKYGKRIREVIEEEEAKTDPKTLKVRIYQRVLQLLDLWEKRDIQQIKDLKKKYEELVKAEEELLKKLEEQLEKAKDAEAEANRKTVEYNEASIRLHREYMKGLEELNAQITKANERLARGY